MRIPVKNITSDFISFGNKSVSNYWLLPIIFPTTNTLNTAPLFTLNNTFLNKHGLSFSHSYPKKLTYDLNYRGLDLSLCKKYMAANNAILSLDDNSLLSIKGTGIRDFLSTMFTNILMKSNINLTGNSTTYIDSINTYLIRKQRVYTKLKYSRSPAYDIASGGIAALLAGLLGFLVSEKFGFELVDSGDFYYVFMYATFISFALLPLVTTISSKRGVLHAISPRNVVTYYKDFIVLVLLFFKK